MGYQRKTIRASYCILTRSAEHNYPKFQSVINASHLLRSSKRLRKHTEENTEKISKQSRETDKSRKTEGTKEHKR